MSVRLHVNVDHVATLRQARGTPYPDPIQAAALCEAAGAHGITVHLREDRRHIQERDVGLLRETCQTFFNLEMACTAEMIAVAERVRPDLVTFVPERREERTTEGGLDVVAQKEALRTAITRLGSAGIPVSLFIAPEAAQVRASITVGAHAIELHTGEYAHATTRGRKGEEKPSNAETELQRLGMAAHVARELSSTIEIAAGHGLSRANVGVLLSHVPQIRELNVGHAIVSDAVLIGLERAVERFLEAMAKGARRA